MGLGLPPQMQTYLPYTDLKINAAVLHEKDLGHQINTGMTILETLKDKQRGWQWHPGFKMWRSNEDLLAQYISRMLYEWKDNGFTDTFRVHERFALLGLDDRAIIVRKIDKPWWWGVKRFHAGQQASLMRHDPRWYGKIFTNTSPGLCEWWPTETEGHFIYGPQPSPDGKFDYIVDGHPMFLEVKRMNDHDFMVHANTFHRLVKSNKPWTMRDAHMFGTLKALHDRFHSLRPYTTHEHVQ